MMDMVNRKVLRVLIMSIVGCMPVDGFRGNIAHGFSFLSFVRSRPCLRFSETTRLNGCIRLRFTNRSKPLQIRAIVQL